MTVFIHKRLARQSGIWRVDGIGNLRDRGRLGLIVQVCFSEIAEGELTAPYGSAAVTGKTLALYVHTATLRVFKVGTLWHEGKRIQSPTSVPGGQTGFRIATTAISAHPLGYRLKVGGHWVDTILPETYYRLGDNRARLSAAEYLLVPVLDNPRTKWLVIPASELLRFYFGLSSRLLGKTIQGRLGDLVSWKESRMDSSTAIVHVRRRINRKEAATFARALANPVASEAMFGPHQKLAVAQSKNATRSGANKLPLTLSAQFPFADETRLIVSGKPIALYREGSADRSEDDQWAVFVMEILHCNHPFDFAKVILETEESLSSKEPGIEPGNIPPGPFQPLLEDTDEEDIELIDQPADARLRRMTRLVFTNQFSGFSSLVFECQHLSSKGRGKSNKEGIEIPVKGFTLGDSTNTEEGKGNLGVSEFQNRIEQVARELSQFLEMIDHLRDAALKWRWSITTPRLLDPISHGAYTLSQFPRYLGNRRTWHLIPEPQGNLRPRQVAVVEVLLPDGRRFYLLEMELRPEEASGQCTILLHLHDFGQLNETTFKDFLVLTAIKNRWPNPYYKWESARHTALAHDLFSRIEVHRFNHPPAPKRNQVSSRPKKAISLDSWSEALLENIRDTIAGAAS